ncbi:OLC1v1018414C1 [Oldenlandia corymbosa var. corymbosa]|uniref:OLC1v1018414C1 n=1 Tax=Oldenlandia corymbosa var. corymbosa TaxID=529605 RepID=A0AAV1EBQ9_OLDCO|nr:OLC1v1018414C1 [Oldenlandia corymbosa var. corymbosa]
METKLISQVIIPPSSPTPTHLKIFKLSQLDQLIPAPYAPIVLFYPNPNSASFPQIIKRVESLKKSLSKTLALFYPLAGTIRDDLSIDCNDKGAYFAVTKVNCQLFQFLNKPDIQMISKFLPCDAGYVGPMEGTRVTNIQVNVFECGGMAIGLCISHKILDGSALDTFLRSWATAAAAAGDGEVEDITEPNFIASSLFPANDCWLRDTAMGMWKSSFKMGNSVTKRFVFDSAAISGLRSLAAAGLRRKPTRVEAVSAFLWKCVMAAGKSKSSMLTHVVNLRKRAVPALSGNSIGNLIWISSAKCSPGKEQPGGLELELPALAEKIQFSISKINGEYIKKMMHAGNDGSSTQMRKSLKEIAEFGSISGGGAEYLGFSSWCGFGFYEVDFGWGKPVWVSSYALSAPVFMNLVILMETRNGDGIEAWVTLDEQEMDVLEQDQQVLEFVTLDPSPLDHLKLC